MKKMLFVTASFFALGAIWMSPLHAMEEEVHKNIILKANKVSTIHNRQQRDHYLEQGLDLNAASFAIKVINEEPEDSEGSENEDATIEDFRSVRDIFRRLAIKDPDYYLADATAYAEGVTAYREVILQDLIIIRDLYLKQGDYKNAAYYNSMLPEKIPLVEQIK